MYSKWGLFKTSSFIRMRLKIKAKGTKVTTWITYLFSYTEKINRQNCLGMIHYY